jgi:hypothetical protein
MLLLFADPLSAMRASLRRWSKDEVDDGVANGGQAGLMWRTVDSFFPSRCQAAMLEKRIGSHRHERMTMQALPGPSFEVVETKLFLQLLVRLFADPSRLDGARQGAQVSLR